MLKLRRSHDRLNFNMVIPIPGKDGLYIESGPSFHHVQQSSILSVACRVYFTELYGSLCSNLAASSRDCSDIRCLFRGNNQCISSRMGPFEICTTVDLVLWSERILYNNYFHLAFLFLSLWNLHFFNRTWDFIQTNSHSFLSKDAKRFCDSLWIDNFIDFKW